MPQTHSRTWQRSWLIDLIGLAGLILFFYTLWLGSYPLFTPDEGRYAEAAREMLVMGDYITPRVNGVAFLDKPILYYWLQTLAIHSFGMKEWAIRLFPACIGMFGCLVTYFCARQLYNRRTGLLSALILATTPLYFASAHYANLDLEVAVWVSCSLLLFITGVNVASKNQRNYFYAAYFFAACAFLTKGLIGIAFPGLIIGMWILLTHRWQILLQARLFTGIVIMTVFVLPWYVLAQQANPEFLHYFFVTQQITRFLSAGEFNNKTPVWFYLPIVLAGFLPWTLFLIQALHQTFRAVWQSRQQHQTELYFFLWISIIFIFFSIPHSKIITYILPIFPAMAILVGHSLAATWEHATQKNTHCSVLGFIGIATLFAVALLLVACSHWFNINPHLAHYLLTISFIFIGSALTAFYYRQRPALLPIFMVCLTCSALCLLTLTLGAKYLNPHSAKPLVVELKRIITPEDEVIHYFKFFQDVPPYLERRVTIVADWNAPHIASKDNWQRELWVNMRFQNTRAWLINEDTFWERWHNDKRVFVFLNENHFEQFKKRAQSYFHFGKYHDIILLSNKPNKDE